MYGFIAHANIHISFPEISLLPLNLLSALKWLDIMRSFSRWKFKYTLKKKKKAKSSKYLKGKIKLSGLVWEKGQERAKENKHTKGDVQVFF